EIPIDNNRTVINYHFIGSGFRGRKFYFHQDPKKSVQKYRDILKWNLLNFAPIECFEKGNSVTFDVFFKNIPEKILNILLFALEPGKRIRHKIGYGKAYGYGSIELSIQDIVYQSKGFNDSISVDLDAIRKTMREQLTNCDTEDKSSIAHFLYKQSLEALSFILWYEESLGYIFTYPSPGENGFNVNHKEEQRTAYNGELRRSIVKSLKKLKYDPNGKGAIKITPQTGKAIAIELKEIKPTLHFAVYQESSTDGKNEIYTKIKKERANNYL
ncbi:MAG: hypothetical protein NT163_00135, partial [Chlorobiales bacterium]|nr:hypothetical protein [Chlorobiales bacterium]